MAKPVMSLRLTGPTGYCLSKIVQNASQ